MEKTAELIRELHPEALKIHNLHVPANTRLLDEYRMGELLVPSTRRHISNTIAFLEDIPDDIVIQRFTCDTASHRLAVPRNFARKGSFFSMLDKEMHRLGKYQGANLSTKGDRE